MEDKEEGDKLLFDIQSLKPRSWVRIECRPHEHPVPAGIYALGGRVIGQYAVPDVYYHRQYGVKVLILLDPVLDEKPFIVLLEDIISLEVIKPSVPDD